MLFSAYSAVLILRVIARSLRTTWTIAVQCRDFQPESFLRSHRASAVPWCVHRRIDAARPAPCHRLRWGAKEAGAQFSGPPPTNSTQHFRPNLTGSAGPHNFRGNITRKNCPPHSRAAKFRFLFAITCPARQDLRLSAGLVVGRPRVIIRQHLAKTAAVCLYDK